MSINSTCEVLRPSSLLLELLPLDFASEVLGPSSLLVEVLPLDFAGEVHGPSSPLLEVLLIDFAILGSSSSLLEILPCHFAGEVLGPSSSLHEVLSIDFASEVLRLSSSLLDVLPIDFVGEVLGPLSSLLESLHLGIFDALGPSSLLLEQLVSKVWTRTDHRDTRWRPTTVATAINTHPPPTAAYRNSPSDYVRTFATVSFRHHPPPTAPPPPHTDGSSQQNSPFPTSAVSHNIFSVVIVCPKVDHNFSLEGKISRMAVWNRYYIEPRAPVMDLASGSSEIS
ncbi:peptide chain release factor 2 [Striga asiatica]|uniref:Peptide chain release factor 2 n=1 Tax=Striga asiatica TaxID=4170 RepID=A0A5A7P5F2_STRAF|nr:peptide chain release factor 2 [Striga asiatica]